MVYQTRYDHRPSRHARRAVPARGARLSLSRRARAGRGAAADDRLGHLRHRQAHVPRRGRPVPGLAGEGARGDLPADPGPRERGDRRGGGGGRRRLRRRRHAARGRRPRGAGAEPRVRDVQAVPARLSLLPLRAARQLRQRARRRRRAAPVRRLGGVPVPEARHRDLPRAGLAARRRRGDDRDLRGHALARARGGAAEPGGLPARRHGRGDRRRRARAGARGQGGADGRRADLRGRPVAEAARRGGAGGRRRGGGRRRAPRRRPRGQRHRLPGLVREGARDGPRRRHDHRGRRVRGHGGGVVQPRRDLRAQPRAAGDRRRGPARLRPHARAARAPRRQRPVRRDGLPPLPGRRRGRGDADRARRRALREGADHGDEQPRRGPPRPRRRPRRGAPDARAGPARGARRDRRRRRLRLRRPLLRARPHRRADRQGAARARPRERRPRRGGGRAGRRSTPSATA